MNTIISSATNREMAWEKMMRELSGYERKTTFYSDFSIADFYGKDAIIDTYNNAIKSWKSNVEYLTELVLVLNHKIWEHYENNETLANIYNDLWIKARDYAEENLKGDELSYYYMTTD